MPIFAWNVPLVSLIFLKRSLIFPILLFSSISLHWSLRKPFLYLLAILHSYGYIFLFLLYLSLLFFSQIFVRSHQRTILPFCISFSWGCSWSLPPVQCHEPELMLFINPFYCLCHNTVIAHRLWKQCLAKGDHPWLQIYSLITGILKASHHKVLWSGRWFSSVRRL